MTPIRTARPRLVALFVVLSAAVHGSVARAQPVPETGVRLSVGFELGNGRMPLFPQDGSSRPKARESFAFGARIGADVGVAPHLALEFALSTTAYLPRDVAVYELHLAPRVRFLSDHRRRELYIRPLVGAAFVAPSQTHVGLAAGLGLGIRRQVTSQYDAFLEVGYRLRWIRGIDADFAATTWPSYGVRTGPEPDAFFCFLGITAGIGVSLGQ